LCTNYVELVLKSSIEKIVGRTLSRVGKSISHTFLFALFHFDHTVLPGLSSCVVRLTKTQPLAALFRLVWLRHSVLFQPTDSATQRECQPRGQCASSGAPDTPVVNAVFQFAAVVIHIHSLIALEQS